MKFMLSMSCTVQKKEIEQSHTADVLGKFERNIPYNPNITLNSTDHGYRVL